MCNALVGARHPLLQLSLQWKCERPGIPESRIRHFYQSKGVLVLRLPCGNVKSVPFPDSVGLSSNLKLLSSHLQLRKNFRAKSL